MTFTLCSSLAIIRKAGSNASSAAIASTALLLDYCTQSEGKFCALTRFDWVANYSTVATEIKEAVADAVSSDAAIKVLGYDPSGYSKLLEAQTIMDMNKDIFDNIVTKLREDKNKGFS